MKYNLAEKNLGRNNGSNRGKFLPSGVLLELSCKKTQNCVTKKKIVRKYKYKNTKCNSKN